MYSPTQKRQDRLLFTEMSTKIQGKLEIILKTKRCTAQPTTHALSLFDQISNLFAQFTTLRLFSWKRLSALKTQSGRN